MKSRFNYDTMGMKQEYKELLLKDICSRLLYGIKCAVHDDTNIYRLSGMIPGKSYELYFEELDQKECDGFERIQYCKPYSRPMSSMTEEESEKFEEYLGLQSEYTTGADIRFKYDMFDWLNSRHFDY